MIVRKRTHLDGVVQGIGFRPFVARVARHLGLTGEVFNTAEGVVIEVEGEPSRLHEFQHRLASDGPPSASPTTPVWEEVALRGGQNFEIAPSTTTGAVGPAAMPGISPDLRLCDACAAELDDPDDRRAGYPFTTCTRCGPRFTIARQTPWDRAATSMASYELCPACRREYGDSSDRRWHAQPIACPACGPELRLQDGAGNVHAQGADAITDAVSALRDGEIVAVLGIGGFQLLVDATNESAVRRLRKRKLREAKPLAVMVADLAAARRVAMLDEPGAAALTGREGPILLARARAKTTLAHEITLGLRQVGLMLPTSALHHLVLREFRGPVVATSANRDGEPMVFNQDTAGPSLHQIADAFLVHDRAVERRADDPVVQVVAGEARVLRLGRGYSPLRVQLPAAHAPMLALGGHLKVTPGLAAQGLAILWSPIGDLHSPASRDALEDTVTDLLRLCNAQPDTIVHDSHPDYATTRYASRFARPTVAVQHHHAHVAAVLAEYGLESGLGFAFDGAGFGSDGTTWGAECLAVTGARTRPIAHLQGFPLPGGDAGARDGLRALAGWLFETRLGLPPELPELPPLVDVAAARPAFAPRVRSVGRLFDGAAALTGVCRYSRYEGEAAMRLQDLAEPGHAPYPFNVEKPEVRLDAMLQGMLEDRHSPVLVASRLHATLAAMVAALARRQDASQVVLSGGCFANKMLAEGCLERLDAASVRGLLPRRVPPGDGGLALGQLAVGAHAVG